MSTPWSSLQSSGVAASDVPPGNIHPAYANYNDEGRPQVGFDVFMELPQVCLKCAEPATTKHVATLNAKNDAVMRLLQTGTLSQHQDRVKSGKYKLDLPHCQPCLDTFNKSRTRYIVSLFSPVFALMITILGAFLYPPAAPIFLLVSIIGALVAQKMARNRYRKNAVLVDTFDSEGFIVLTGVDIQAGEAIVVASGGVL